MTTMKITRKKITLSLALVAVLLVVGTKPSTSSYIVQGESAQSVAALVQSAGGEVTHELGIIRSVGATLTAAEAASLRIHAGVRRVYGNEAIEVTPSLKRITRRWSTPMRLTQWVSQVRESALLYSIPACGSTMASNMIPPALRGLKHSTMQ
jgi:hypothetical protein